MKTKYILHFIFFFCLTTSLFSQAAFERAYSIDSTKRLTAADLVQTSDGGYLFLSESYSNPPEKANVTKVNPKGDIVWSKDYRIGHEIGYQFFHLILLEKDSFVFAAHRNQPGLDKGLCKVAPNGEVVWTKAYGNPKDVKFSSPFIVPLVRSDQSLILVGEAQQKTVDFLSTSLYIAFMNQNGTLLKAQTLVPNHGDFSFFFPISAEVTLNNDVIFTNKNYLVKMNSLGVPQWNREYKASLVSSNRLRFHKIISTPDSGFLVVGVQNNSSDGGAIIIKLDSLGLPQWSKKIKNQSNNLGLINAVNTSDGGYIVVGTSSNQSSNERYTFACKFDDIGNIIWQNKFISTTSSAFFINSFIVTQDGGAAILTNAKSGDNYYPYLIKLDSTGSSSCEEPIDLEISPLNVILDTFDLVLTPMDTFAERTATTENFTGFNIPTLNLEAPEPYCEGDPIFWTFDATTTGAVSYEWNTGETSDSISVIDKGMYSVDVRIETDGCYNLSDTVFIETIGAPEIDITKTGSICQDGEATLSLRSLKPSETLIWDTGKSTQDIVVTEERTYHITVTNECGFREATYVLDESPPEVTITILESDCLTDSTTLSYQSNVPVSVIWEDGSTEETFVATQDGIYSLMATSDCGMDEASFQVNCTKQVENCVKVPNVFTPNEDSINDDFFPIITEDCAGLMIIRDFRIYNRWGQLVFEGKDNMVWDGTINGKLAPSDVYVYYIEVENQSFDDAPQITVLSKDVTLVR